MAAQRCALVTSGVVTNIILADPATFTVSGSLVIANATNQVGDTYAGGVFTTVVQPNVPTTTNLGFEQFLTLFTAAELTAIMTAAPTNPTIFVWLLKAVSYSLALNLSSPLIANALAYLVSQSLITSARQTAILAGTVMNPSA